MGMDMDIDIRPAIRPQASALRPSCHRTLQINVSEAVSENVTQGRLYVNPFNDLTNHLKPSSLSLPRGSADRIEAEAAVVPKTSYLRYGFPRLISALMSLWSRLV